MRIIGGTLKGRQLNAPKNLPVRPTTDYAKTGLFNILDHALEISSCEVLDLFAGTGSIGLEFASRGAKAVTSVDQNYLSYKFIRDTLTQYNLKNLRAQKYDVFKFLKSCSFQYDIIFADPPYQIEDIERVPEMIFSNNLLKPDGILILEHSFDREIKYSDHFKEKRTYGNVAFSFFQISKT